MLLERGKKSERSVENLLLAGITKAKDIRLFTFLTSQAWSSSITTQKFPPAFASWAVLPCCRPMGAHVGPVSLRRCWRTALHGEAVGAGPRDVTKESQRLDSWQRLRLHLPATRWKSAKKFRCQKGHLERVKFSTEQHRDPTVTPHNCCGH